MLQAGQDHPVCVGRMEDPQHDNQTLQVICRACCRRVFTFLGECCMRIALLEGGISMPQRVGHAQGIHGFPPIGACAHA